jgi:hypothetical protein
LEDEEVEALFEADELLFIDARFDEAELLFIAARFDEEELPFEARFEEAFPEERFEVEARFEVEVRFDGLLLTFPLFL